MGCTSQALNQNRELVGSHAYVVCSIAHSLRQNIHTVVVSNSYEYSKVCFSLPSDT